MAEPAVQVVIDKRDEVIKNLRALAGIQVMVGIPSTRNARSNEDGHTITNAALGYIHEFGSPAANIPARPFLKPGVQNAIPQVKPRLLSAAKAAVRGLPRIMMQQLNAAGIAASNEVKRKITEGPFVPLAPSTLARRRAKLLGTTSLTAQQRRQGFKDIRPLIDTGQLRASITYVIRNRQGNNIGGLP